MDDVVIAGASIAGACTALHLARRGITVRVLDRAVFPRRKSCGEGLFSSGAQVLDRLGLLEAVRPRARLLDSLRVEIDGAAAEAPLTQPSLGVRREVLDAALLDLASDSGIDICAGVTATGLVEGGPGYSALRTDHGDFGARVIVAADGLRSRLRRIAGLDAPIATRRYGASAHYELPDEPPARVHIRMRRDHEIYVTPVGGNLVNVALLMRDSRARRLGGRLNEAYASVVADAGVLPEGSRLIEAPLAAGPFPSRARRAWRDNLLLAGDAAGFFDGISGEGMSLALVSSGLAAGAIERYLSDGDMSHFEAYERARNRLARNSTLLARVSLLLASRPALGRYAMSNLGRRTATFEKVLAINAGAAGLGVLRPRDVASALLGL